MLKRKLKNAFLVLLAVILLLTFTACYEQPPVVIVVESEEAQTSQETSTTSDTTSLQSTPIFTSEQDVTESKIENFFDEPKTESTPISQDDGKPKPYMPNYPQLAYEYALDQFAHRNLYSYNIKTDIIIYDRNDKRIDSVEIFEQIKHDLTDENAPIAQNKVRYGINIDGQKSYVNEELLWTGGFIYQNCNNKKVKIDASDSKEELTLRPDFSFPKEVLNELEYKDDTEVIVKYDSTENLEGLLGEDAPTFEKDGYQIGSVYMAMFISEINLDISDVNFKINVFTINGYRLHYSVSFNVINQDGPYNLAVPSDKDSYVLQEDLLEIDLPTSDQTPNIPDIDLPITTA